MTDTPPRKQPSLHVIDGDDSTNTNTTQHVRKRDKVREFLGIPKPKTKDLKNKASNQSLNVGPTPQVTSPPLLESQAIGPPIVDSQPKDGYSDDNMSISFSVAADKPLPTSPPPTAAKRLLNGFPNNLPKPALRADLPALLDRIEKTEQLVYCNSLLVQASSLTTTADAGEGEVNTTSTTTTITMQMKPTLTDKELKWLAEMDNNPMVKARIRWMATRMVEEFIQDPNKDSVKIAEVVALGPVLDREPYHKLLSSIIGGFENARVLDVNLLQGLVQLVQSASPGFLVSDDMIKIFSLLRIRLQSTHRQSSEHAFHLTLAVSLVLDVMAEHEVKDLNRVEEHEPLSGVLLGLKECSDPYLMYQACYAFQALQYIPDDETALQAVLRHSSGVVEGLVKVSAVFKLDLGSVLKGLGKLQEALGGVIGTASTVYEGVCSVMASGQGALDSLKEGFGSGEKRPWYAAIRVSYALVQSGRLQDLQNLIYEAPCRCDPLFQWGICQLMGEIAYGDVWDTAVRQHAVALFGELYKNDQDWGQDESVNAWMLNIIAQISGVKNQAVSSSARILFQELKQDQDITTVFPYPLRNNLSVPSSSPILSSVQDIPFVEYDLYQLKVQRLKQSHLKIYIPPQAKASLRAKDDDLFSLMEKVQEFMAGERQVMLVLGDSGAGKSTFNRHLEHRLWTAYKQGEPIPLFINLPAIDRPDQDLISKQLKVYNFKDDQVQEIKQHRRLILICDGYDESQQLVNLHYTNRLNQPGQWNTKMIISCRTQFLGPTYIDRFKPQSDDQYASSQKDFFQEAVIAPFSKEQIQNYIQQYVPLEPRTWRTQDYMDRLTTIPNLLDLVRNPFLLTLTLEALPGVTEGKKDLSKIKISRVQLYDTFVHHWLGVNQRRLQKNNALSSDDKDILVQLVDADFVCQGIEYSSKLAQAIFDKQDGNPVVEYVHLRHKNTWKTDFFGPQPEIRLLRESSPLTRTGNQFRFVHRSMLEYFLSRVIYDPARIDNQECDPQTDTVSSAATLIDVNGPFFRQNLLQEPSIILFLCDRVKLNPDFEQQLRSVINLSKTDSSVTSAATNSITILVKAGALFNGADLRGIQIPGADLSNGQFDSAQLQGADLTGVTLSRSWLRQADLSGARLKDVRFGEQPYLDVPSTSCTYSPDGRVLVVRGYTSGASIYDTSTWKATRQINSDVFGLDLAFSPDNKHFVIAGNNGVIQSRKCSTGEKVFTIKGPSHKYHQYLVKFSPCGKQIASASGDRTVRLWDSRTGESQFVLEGHTKSISSVKYSPDGSQLVSGSEDETIRFWNPQTGEPSAVLHASLGKVLCLAYSPDGQWIASGHEEEEDLLLWNAATREPGLVLTGHSKSVTGVEFSPSGLWIASSSYDQTVRLWDAYCGTLLSVWTSHNNPLLCVAFSPDGLQIASGGDGDKVQLWEVDSVWLSLDPQVSGHVDQIAYVPDGRAILERYSSGVLRKWDAGTGTSSESIPLEFPEPQAVSCMAFTPDGSQLAVGYENGSIHLWSLQTSIAGPILEGHSSKVRTLVYSPCRRWIASVHIDETLQLWDLHNMEQPCVLANYVERLGHRLLPKASKIVCIAMFSPTGYQLAIGSLDRIVRLFDLPSMERSTYELDLKLYDSAKGLLSMVYSPNGRQIAIGGHFGYISLWDLQSDKPTAELSGNEGSIRCIAYSSCGQWLASGSDDYTVGIWHRQISGEVESWSRVHSIRSFFARVHEIAWNPVAHMEFVTRCRDGSIRVWRMSSTEDGNVVVNMLWGSNLGKLQIEGLVFENVTSLSPLNQRLLVQHATGSSIPNKY